MQKPGQGGDAGWGGRRGESPSTRCKENDPLIVLNNVRNPGSTRKWSGFEGVSKSFHVTNLILILWMASGLVHLRSSIRCIGPILNAYPTYVDVPEPLP
jgi:hypothetical protein